MGIVIEHDGRFWRVCGHKARVADTAVAAVCRDQSGKLWYVERCPRCKSAVRIAPLWDELAEGLVASGFRQMEIRILEQGKLL